MTKAEMIELAREKMTSTKTVEVADLMAYTNAVIDMCADECKNTDKSNRLRQVDSFSNGTYFCANAIRELKVKE